MGCPVLVVLAAGAGRRFGGYKQLAPVGPNGEALMDYTIDRAIQAGFERVVVVTRPDLHMAVRSHFAQRGRSSIGVVDQPADAFGTVPAVLAARRQLGDDQSFGVVNADDLYPPDGLRALSAWAGPAHAMLGFRLGSTMLPGSGPVSRALCHCDGDGRLLRLAEATITCHASGMVARELGRSDVFAVAAGQLVSMNAWALRPSIWAGLEHAVAGGAAEVLLPVVVASMVAEARATVTVVPVSGSCPGITWPHELEILRALVGRMVAAGKLPAGTGLRLAEDPGG